MPFFSPAFIGRSNGGFNPQETIGFSRILVLIAINTCSLLKANFLVFTTFPRNVGNNDFSMAFVAIDHLFGIIGFIPLPIHPTKD